MPSTASRRITVGRRRERRLEPVTLHNRVLQKINGCLLNGADLQQDIP
jgi:hypothetical protein